MGGMPGGMGGMGDGMPGGMPEGMAGIFNDPEIAVLLQVSLSHVYKLTGVP